MSVNIFTYLTISDVDASALGVVSFLNEFIDTAYVSNKTISYEHTDIPDWAIQKNSEPVSEYHEVKSVLQFHYHGTDFCFVGYTFKREGYDNEVKLRIYARNSQGVTTGLIYSTTTPENWSFLIGQNNDYFVFAPTKKHSQNYHYCVFRIDAPTNSNDTGVFVSVLPDIYLCYNKAFKGEDLSERVYLINDAGRTDVAMTYDSNFARNFYNNKIPVYNVYAHTRLYGVRGKIKSLLVLPNSYTTSSDTFYSVNGNVYVGLNNLNEQIKQYYRGVLLRVY